MQKRPRNSVLFDRLHKGFVCTCVAVTIYATSVFVMRGYRYYMYEKPELQAKQLLEKQKLLAEGAPDMAPNIQA